MRLWSLHPHYLDVKGLLAVWREGLLARHVLAGKTVGYRNHPQLRRFREAASPLDAIDCYLAEILREAERRNYSFDREKIGRNIPPVTLPVTAGQLAYERSHLLRKLAVRDPEVAGRLAAEAPPLPHPMFQVREGGVEPWEIRKKTKNANAFGIYSEELRMEESIRIRETPHRGFGVFAARNFAKDEVIAEFKGPIVKIENMEGIPKEVWDHLLNVAIDEYMIVRDPVARINHSCEPNAGIVRNVFLVAMRDIAEGEEITFDYSTTTVDNWSMECECGSPSCRKIIGNYNGLSDELKKKYEKYTPDWLKNS